MPDIFIYAQPVDLTPYDVELAPNTGPSDPTHARPLAGATAGEATVTAGLSSPIHLDGQSNGNTTIVVQSTTPRALVAESDGTAVTTADTLIFLVVLASDSPGPVGSGAVTGDWVYVGPLHFSANIAGSATVVAATRWRGLLLPAASTGSAAVIGEVRKLWALTGSPIGGGTALGDFQIYTIPPGPIVGETTVTTTGLTIQGHMRGEADGSTVFGTDARGLQLAYFLAAPQTSNGVASVKAYIYDYPGDFQPVTVSGLAGVTAKIVLAPLALAAQVPGVGSVAALLGIRFTITHAGIANGFATVDFALLQINDAGLSRGSALVAAQVTAVSGGASVSRGFATFILGPSFTLAGDLRGTTVDTWSGVGSWHAGSQTYIAAIQEVDQRPPVVTGYNPDGSPIYGSLGSVNEVVFPRNNYEHINVGYWDGTYTYGPTESGAPITDPEAGYVKYVKVGSLKRQFSLADPGQLGGWYVDDRSYRTRGPWGTSAGIAAVTADLFVEAKNALYGQPVGQATVTVTLIRLIARLLTVTGNVALAMAMTHIFGGNAAKSSGPFMPIEDPRRGTDPDVFVPPVTRDRTMYV